MERKYINFLLLLYKMGSVLSKFFCCNSDNCCCYCRKKTQKKKAKIYQLPYLHDTESFYEFAHI